MASLSTDALSQATQVQVQNPMAPGRHGSDGHSILGGRAIASCAAAVVLFLCVSSPLHFPLKLGVV